MKGLLNILKFIPLGAAIVTLNIFTWMHICDYKGDIGPKFYGFPLIFRTEVPWLRSLSGRFYLAGFIVDTLIYSLIIGLLLKIIGVIKSLRLNKNAKIVVWIFITIISTLIIIQNHININWKYYWFPVFEGYFKNPSLTCDKKWIFPSL